MKAWIWARALLLLASFYLLVHGPRLPAPRASEALELEATLVGVLLASALLLVLAGLGWAIMPDARPRSRLLTARPSAWLHTAAAVLGLAWSLDGAFQLAGLEAESALGRLHELFERLDAGQRVLAAGLLGLVPGVAEELCFRGWLLGALRRASGARWAIAGSSLAFGLFHFDPVHAGLTAALGAVLAVSVVRTGALGPAILAHALNNAVAVLGAGARSSVASVVLVTVLGLGLFAWGMRGLCAKDDAAPGAF